MPGFAAAVLGARATGVASVPAQARSSPPVPSPPVRFARGGVALVRRAVGWLGRARDWSADRRSQAVAAGAAVLLLLAMVALLLGKATAPHPAHPPRTGGGTEGPALATVPAAPDWGPSARSTAEPASPIASGTAATQSAAAAVSVQLAAAYKTEDLQLTAYRVTVLISNPGPATADDWTLVIVLPLLDLSVRNVEGAVMTRTDLRVIFTPIDSTRTVRPASPVTVRFEVEGLGVRNAPLTCTIDGRPCSQNPG